MGIKILISCVLLGIAIKMIVDTWSSCQTFEALNAASAYLRRLMTRVQTMSTDEIKEYTARMITELRSGNEAQEERAAFFEKRKPG